MKEKIFKIKKRKYKDTFLLLKNNLYKKSICMKLKIDVLLVDLKTTQPA